MFLGSTLHKVNEYVDEGEIISQAIFPKKNCELMNVMNKLFQTGALQLFNYLYIGKRNYYYNFKDYYFNPSLKYDPNIFDNNFWNKIKRS